MFPVEANGGKSLLVVKARCFFRCTPHGCLGKPRSRCRRRVTVRW